MSDEHMHDGREGGFGPKLREVREARGHSLRQVARQAGISAPYLSDIERGNRKAPRVALVQELARVLCCPELVDLGLTERGDQSVAKEARAQALREVLGDIDTVDKLVDEGGILNRASEVLRVLRERVEGMLHD